MPKYLAAHPDNNEVLAVFSLDLGEPIPQVVLSRNPDLPEKPAKFYLVPQEAESQAQPGLTVDPTTHEVKDAQGNTLFIAQPL